MRFYRWNSLATNRQRNTPKSGNWEWHSRNTNKCHAKWTDRGTRRPALSPRTTFRIRDRTIWRDSSDAFVASRNTFAECKRSPTAHTKLHIVTHPLFGRCHCPRCRAMHDFWRLRSPQTDRFRWRGYRSNCTRWARVATVSNVLL